MITHLLTRIDLMMNSLSKGQKRIALFIEEHYDKAAFMTASKLGETVGVSESTVVRFATELGYDGYPKLQKAMQEMIRNKLTSVQRIEVTSNRIGNDNVLDSVLNQDIDKIRRTIEETSHEDFARAVDEICKAERIYILGVRSTAAIANFLAYYFEMIFDNVRVITSGSQTETFEQIFRITDSMVSPLVQSADSVLIARSDMASIVDSLVAPLSLINALIVATVLKKKDEVSDTFRRLELVWNRDGVYTNREREIVGNIEDDDK